MLRHSSHHVLWRTVAVVLVATQAAFGLPVVVRARTRVDPTATPPPPPVVHINHTVPKVAAPPIEPRFSSSPTVAEIARARVFDEPLVPVDGTPSDEENRALSRALLAFHRNGGHDWRTTIGRYLDDHPDSVWRASLLANLGTIESRAHGYASALDAWDAAWSLTSRSMDPKARTVADYAVSEWLMLAASFGQVDKVRERLNMLTGRSLTGSAGVKIQRARETVSLIESYPDLSTLCGPQALRALIEASGKANPRGLAMLDKYRGDLKGMSLVELQVLGKRVGVDLVMAERIDARDVPVPSIVHWKIGHYATVVERQAAWYRVVDRARHDSYWIDRQTLVSESSGYFLIPQGTVHTGWRAVDAVQARAVIGSGPLCPDGAAPPAPPDSSEGCNCGGGGGGPSGGPNPGMAGYAFQSVTASLLLSDTPVGYRPPRGPAVDFTLLYDQRESTQPQLFNYANTGAKWTLNWIRFVKEEPTDGLGVTPAHVWVAIPPGGQEAYINPDAQGTYEAHWSSRAVLVHVSDDPVRYERRLPDGTVEVYGQSDGAPAGSRRIFLTQVIDPQGQTLALTWDAQSRLVAVVDAIGQVSTIEYGDSTNVMRVSRITDPFGRQCSLAYNAAGDLESITDAMGLTSRFAYGDNDFVTTLTTPYGPTTFRSEQPALNSGYTMRFIEATDPIGGTEHLEFQYQTATLSPTASAGEVPSGFEPWNTNLDHFNTFAWNKRAWAEGPGDITKATVTHWLEAPEFNGWQIYSMPVPHSIKRPLESRVWYAYPGQTAASAHLVGWWKQPTATGRVLDGGVSQVWAASYNTEGRVLSRTDPLGRQTTFTYDSNDIDLVAVRQSTASGADLLESYSNYTGGHQPQAIIDAAGQVTTLTYNSAGQVLTVTNPRQETTTYSYDENGNVSSVAGPMSAAAALTYDGFGRIRTLTGPDGYQITVDYDLIDRPIRITSPDGTYDETTYDRLDASAQRDRRGRVVRFYHDAMHRVIAVRNPLGQTVTQVWCSCGSLDAVVDAKGHRTSWQRDLEGRVISEIRADGSSTHYSYALSDGRLVQRTDAKGQVTAYQFDVDDALLAITYSNATIATPSVTFAYDASYPRPMSRTDGTGITAYTYRSAGTLGAGHIASIEGPLANDTITYSYDALGRVASRTLGNTTDTSSYDPLGRLASIVDPLGTFAWAYDGATSRVAQITYPNGQTSNYSYMNNAADRRLQEIRHQAASGAVLSRFTYTYDGVGNVTTWTQQYQATSRAYDFTYDDADQLKGATYRTTDTPPTSLTRYLYRYDSGGNRTNAQTDDAPLAWTFNTLNQMTAQGGSELLQFEGTINEPGTVTVSGKPATVDATGKFTGAAAVTNGTNTVAVTATDVAGNATTQAYDVDVTDVTGTFAYDANGNLTSRGTRGYAWDAENRLVRVTDGGVELASFTYDGVGRRASKSAGGLTHRYVYDDSDIIEDRLDGGTTLRTVHGPQIDQPLASVDGNGTVSYYLADHLGSIVQTTDASSQVTLTRQYDPWGRITAGGNASGYAFTGREWDAETGLYYYRARFLDPTLGSFISSDPAGLVDGPNTYAYVSNNPTNSRDPGGLWDLDLHGLKRSKTLSIDEDCRKETGGACTFISLARVVCDCECTDSGWKAKATLVLYGEMFIYSGPFANLKRTPKDKSVVDARTAEAHEWKVHLDVAIRAVTPLLDALEGKTFDSEQQCQAACGATSSAVDKLFRTVLHTTQAEEDKKK